MDSLLPAAGEATRSSRESDFHTAGGEMLRLGCWMGLLVCGWVLQKALCTLGLPGDCDGIGKGYGAAYANGWLGHIEGLQHLCSYGAIAGWLLGVHSVPRHRYLFRGQSMAGRPIAPGVFPVAYLVCIVIFSAVLSMRLFEGNIRRGSGNFSGSYLGLHVLDVIGGLVTVTLAAWHIVYGWRHSETRFAFAFGYLLPRLAVILWHVGYFVVLVPRYASREHDGSWHLPHWICGFILACGCRWNHPLSVASLALTSAIFTQGLSAYDIDPMITEEKCVHFESLSGVEMAVSEFSCNGSASDPSFVDVCVRSGARLTCIGVG